MSAAVHDPAGGPAAEGETAKASSDVLRVSAHVAKLAQNMEKLSQMVDSLANENADLKQQLAAVQSGGFGGLGARPVITKRKPAAPLASASERARRYVQACTSLQVRPNKKLVKEFPHPDANGVLDFAKDGNYIGSDGVLPLLEIIEGDAFKELLLKGQGLLDDAAIALADRLKGHATVRKMDLSDNKIAVQGAIKLRELVLATPSLVEINVANNLIDTYTANKLRSALQKNERGGAGGPAGTTSASVVSNDQLSTNEVAADAEAVAADEEEDDPSLNALHDQEEKEQKKDRAQGALEDDGFLVDSGEGEQFGAVKPWKGVVDNMVPTGFRERKDMKDEPDDQLELEFVHGYRAHDARRNLFYVGDGTDEIVYHAAAVGIVYSGFRGEGDDMRKRTQRFFNQHDDDIIALAMHPKGALVATGQVGKDGLIYVWDTKSMAIKATLKGFHKRGVVALAFSASGTKLVSVGLDDDHTVAVWDWMKSNKPVGREKGDKNKILLAEFKPGSETEFVTVGAQHIKFWTIDGAGKPKGSLGSAKGKCTAQKAYHSIAWVNGTCVTGTTDGALYKWQGGSATEAVPAHKGPVFALANTADGGLISGAKDGLLKFWDTNMKCTSTVDLGKQLRADPIGSFVGEAPAIRALHVRGDAVLVGTQSSQILEVVRGRAQIFMAAHGASGTWKGQPADYQGELWGLDVEPGIGIHTKWRYVTCCDDRTVRMWSVQRKTCVAVGTVSAPAKRVTWSPNGAHLACGLLAGQVEILDAETMEVKAKIVANSSGVAAGDISDIRYSPDGATLAVASHDSFIYLFDVKAGYKKRVRCPPTGKGHSGTVWHIDFSSDGSHIQASDSAGEILFWSVDTGMQNKKYSGLKDTTWATQTCVLGWPVQGIYAPGLKLTDINAVDRALNNKCLAIGDDFCSVQLVKYPCISEDCKRRRYKGHSEHVTNVRFTNDDLHLISTGGADLSIFQWRHVWTGMPKDEDEEQDAEAIANYDRKVEKGERRHAQEVDEDDDFGMDSGEGEQFGAVKPWLGTINALVPEGWKDDPKLKKKPDDELVLDFVHGYRSHDARNNLFYLGSGTDEIVYHAAALGIVYEKGPHAQRFFRKHDDDILCLALHPDGQTVATGQVGKKAPIHVWNATRPDDPPVTLQFHQRGVCCLAFSRDGKSLVSVGLDDNHTVAVWDWKGKKKLGDAKGGPDPVFDVVCSPHADGEFVTMGVKHVKFWSGGAKPVGKLGSKGKGMEDQKAFHSACWINPTTVVVGTTTGALYKYTGGSGTEAIPAHSGPVFAVHATADGKVLSGSKDGTVMVWDAASIGAGAKAQKIDLNKLLATDPSLSLATTPPAVRSLCVKDGKCVAGLMSSTIVEIDVASGSAKTLLAAHGASGTFKGKPADYQGEIWGLGVHPNRNEFVTCSDDRQLRFWDVASRKCKRVLELKAQGRSAAYSPDAAHIAVGLWSGDLQIFDAKSGNPICTLATGAGKIAKEELGELDYSPDGNYLAVGSHDNGIYIYSVKDNYKQVARCKGHSSYIRHLDWNESSNIIQSDCGAYELLFWQAPSGSRLNPRDVKGQKWATQSCVIGWPVQGVFEPGWDGLDVKSVDRSKDGTLLAIGTNFRTIGLARYPCLTDASDSRKRYGGHSEFVTNVRWTSSDDFLLSVGGADLCVMQWKRLKGR